MVLVVVPLVTIVAVLIAYALPFSSYLNFHPLNGAFQTFNPTRRILSGMFPGDGFQPYLGIGVAYFHAGVTLLFGGDFAASQFMSRLLPPVVVLAYIALLLYLSGMRLGPAMLVIWLAFMLLLATVLGIGLTPWGLTLPDLFTELLEPGNSTLAVRLLLPLLSVAVILAFPRLVPAGALGKPGFRAAVFGALTGLQPFWCNDYGIASCLCLTVTFWLAVPRPPHRNFATIGFWVMAFVVAFGAALWFAGGSDWLRYNFRGVAGDQFWYFGLSSEGRVYRLADTPLPSWIWVYALACAWLLWRAARHPDGRGARWILFYVSTTPLVAGLIATMGGGIPSDRYSLPVRVLLPFVISAALLDVYREGRATDNGKNGHSAAREIGTTDRRVLLPTSSSLSRRVPSGDRRFWTHFARTSRSATAIFSSPRSAAIFRSSMRGSLVLATSCEPKRPSSPRERASFRPSSPPSTWWRGQ